MRRNVLTVLWISGVSCFTLVSAWNVPSLGRRQGLTHPRATLTTLLQHGATFSHNEFEETARSVATNVLQSVLVPENGTKVERELKVALRDIHDGRMRQRVSQLVLGTTVMQKRHAYIYNVTRHLDSEKVRCMVNLHAEYLNSTDEDCQNSVTWPVNPVERIAVQYSMPAFLVKSWMDEYGEIETEALCNISNRPGPITLRRNALRCSSDDELILRLEADDGIKLSPPNNAVSGCLGIISDRPKSIWAMSAWRDGWFEVQDQGSQRIIAATQLSANDKVVVDYCAGNGGKTLAMVSKLYELNSSATMWAHDVKELRLAQLRGSLSRVGVSTDNDTSIQVVTTSCAKAGFRDEMANVVLVDAPCSSCGVLRRRPGHRWELTQGEMEHDLPELQLEILMNASRLVKPGGRLIYATCSLCHCENEDVADAWERQESFASSWEPWLFHCSDTWPIESDPHLPGHYCKLMPHKHDSDGFFIARWKRKPE